MHRARTFMLACKRSAPACLKLLQEKVPAPLPEAALTFELSKPWNEDSGKPPLEKWLTVDKPADHTDRLSMMGNAVLWACARKELCRLCTLSCHKVRETCKSASLSWKVVPAMSRFAFQRLVHAPWDELQSL